DADQCRGIGTLLLAVMWLTALRAGVEQLVAYTLQDNRRAAKWMQDCGASGSWDGYKLVFRWNLNQPADLPITPSAVDLAAWLTSLSPMISRVP
ncbi:MAG: hypothetical protein WCP35_21020, partial [Verrucomicrobiota bacterium]